MKTILFKNIPEDIYRQFKAACAQQGRPMKDVFIEFMKDFVEANMTIIHLDKGCTLDNISSDESKFISFRALPPITTPDSIVREFEKNIKKKGKPMKMTLRYK